MRYSSGRWIVATLLVVLLAGAPARADRILPCEFHWNRTALALAALIYSHLPTVPHEGWAQDQWREMHARTARLQGSRASDPVGGACFRDMGVREGEWMLARDFGSDAPAEPAAEAGGSIASTLTGPNGGGYAYGRELATYTRDDLYGAIRDLPEASLAFASYVVRFTSAAFAVTLNLNGVVLRETRLDWDTLMRQKRGLQDRLADWKKNRGEESLAALVETRTRLGILERMARSSFKIGFGVMLGLAMWLFVRRF